METLVSEAYTALSDTLPAVVEPIVAVPAARSFLKTPAAFAALSISADFEARNFFRLECKNVVCQKNLQKTPRLACPNMCIKDWKSTTVKFDGYFCRNQHF